MAFYRKDEYDNVFDAPKYVYHKDFELHVAQKDTYSYPVSGWYWFDTMEEAYGFFGVDMPEE